MSLALKALKTATELERIADFAFQNELAHPADVAVMQAAVHQLRGLALARLEEEP